MSLIPVTLIGGFVLLCASPFIIGGMIIAAPFVLSSLCALAAFLCFGALMVFICYILHFVYIRVYDKSHGTIHVLVGYISDMTQPLGLVRALCKEGFFSLGLATLKTCVMEMVRRTGRYGLAILRRAAKQPHNWTSLVRFLMELWLTPVRVLAKAAIMAVVIPYRVWRKVVGFVTGVITLITDVVYQVFGIRLRMIFNTIISVIHQAAYNIIIFWVHMILGACGMVAGHAREILHFPQRVMLRARDNIIRIQHLTYRARAVPILGFVSYICDAAIFIPSLVITNTISTIFSLVEHVILVFLSCVEASHSRARNVVNSYVSLPRGVIYVLARDYCWVRPLDTIRTWLRHNVELPEILCDVAETAFANEVTKVTGRSSHRVNRRRSTST
ncbi:uncharacterized protein LOC116601379 isoform X2 [Nematostella vectensis]|uniref:uncharacterized protein LOC116601379 isoform X2 n=1 Tax=Nematostella vectensis TaxID=45351 RepID=UPI002076F7A4|nr:uncharacterized protein LOC116601379 isoform X2 [Nematostella vectensis]XP_032218018.2 uncharacterized protein LOC116601379 isoform X2 [Nematostella vectensis]